MSDLMTLALLVILALIIAVIGYSCYRVGYDKGSHDGMDMQRMILKVFERDGGEERES